jgi:hypothetical protein
MSFSFLAPGQDTALFKAGLHRGGGFIITHSPTMEYITGQHLSTTTFYFEKKLNGSKAWHARHNYPTAGAECTYFNFHQTALGKGIGLAPYFSFQLAAGRKWDSHLKTLAGVGFIEKPFHPDDNYKNTAIGSRLNIYVGLRAEVRYFPLSRIGISGKLGFSHFSNTSFSKPNLGINLPHAEMGLVYRWGKAEFIPQVEKDSSIAGKWAVRLGMGVSESSQLLGPKFMATAFHLYRQKAVNRKNSFAGGLDLYHTPAIKRSLAADSIFIENSRESLQIGLGGYYLLTFGKLSTGVKVGIYLKNRDRSLPPTYQEVFGQLPLGRDWYAVLIMKTHLARAEYLLGGLTYLF